MAVSASKTPALSELVDELGALEKEYASLKPKFERIDTLRKAIREQHESKPAGETFTVEGKRFAMVVGAKGNQRKVNVVKLCRAIGQKAFLALVSVTLQALTDHDIPATVVAAVVTEAQTGPRSIRCWEKAAAA